MSVFDFIVLFARDALWSGVAAVGFAILFNVPRRLLLGCVLTGAVGHSIRLVLTTSGSSIEFATFIGAAAVGFLSIYLARYFRVPASLFAVTGAIPMVPGVFAYQTIIGLLNATSATNGESVDLLAVANVNGVKTALILAAIALGTAAPTLLFQRSKPIV